MSEQKNDTNRNHETPDAGEVNIPVMEMDAASRSLSEALGVSFIILKVIMAVVIVAFLGSGFKTIGPGEQALVLRFGKLCEINNEQGADPHVRGAGLIWTFPYPIDEVIRIPVKEKVPFEIRSFWYYQTPDEILGTGPKSPRRVGPKLNPVTDGYTLVRGEGLPGLAGTAAGSDNGTDYNLMHSKWQVVYEIADISRFFRNVQVADSRPGEIYFDVIKRSVTPIIQSVVEDTIVDVLVGYSIEEAIESSERIPRSVTDVAQARLDRMDSGIRLVSVTVKDRQPPQQVQESFNALHTAKQMRETQIKEAETFKKTTLNEAAGAVAEPLARALENPDTLAAELETLWKQATGDVSVKITEGETYRSQVVQRARAFAHRFESLLTQYRERPQLVLDNLYLEAIAEVFALADEKIILQPGNSQQEREVRIELSRDTSLKTKKRQP